MRIRSSIVVVLFVLLSSWTARISVRAAAEPVISVAVGQFALTSAGGTTLGPQDLYSTSGGLHHLLPSFLPAGLGLDAVDVDGDSVWFSVRSSGLVRHSGGTIYLRHDRPYRFDPISSSIAELAAWSEAGIDAGSLDALDRLSDSRIVFSTEATRGIHHAGGYLVLRPENAYVFDPSQGSVTLLFDGRATGLIDLDGIDLTDDGRIAFSTATDVLVVVGGAGRYLRHNDVYLLDGGSPFRIFEGGRLGLQSVDAFTLNPDFDPDAGIVIEYDGDPAPLVEGSALATASYFVSLSEPPTSSVAVALSSPDGQVRCAPDRLSFGAGDWNLPRSVLVWAVDDSQRETPIHWGSILHVVETEAVRFASAEARRAVFAIVDDDGSSSGGARPISTMTGAAGPVKFQRDDESRPDASTTRPHDVPAERSGRRRRGQRSR